MSTSMLLGLFDWIGDFFKALFNLIPKIIYLLYASLACIIDVLQLFFRKLAGLDVYYVNGEAVSGDLVGNFIRGIFGMYDRSNITYSALATVFYSMLVFGIIICFASVLIAIIKSHYTYDEKSAKGPMQFVYTGVKSIINMVAVPIIVVMGLYVSNAILNALDTITSVNSGSVASMFGNGINYFQSIDTAKAATGKNNEKTYLYYDMFGYSSFISYGSTSGAGNVARAITTEEIKDLTYIGSKTQTFSGSLFRVGAYNANRARIGQYSVDRCWGMEDIFQNAKNQTSKAKQNAMLAEMIDTVFANNMHMTSFKVFTNEQVSIVDSTRYFTNFLVGGAMAFSKFNVGAVWFFYDLWQFNFIVGFAGVIVCVSIFINIIMGLMVRFFMCITLFLVAPPIFGLAPLDGGSAGKKWRENFMKQALMTYGAVVGMNLMMMILPYLYEIDFFNIPIIDLLAQSLFIIVGLVTIKAVIALMSELIGAADANKTGGDIAKEVGSVAGKAANMTLGAAKIGTKVGGNLTMAGINLARAGAQKGMAGANLLRANNMEKRANALRGLSTDSADQAARMLGSGDRNGAMEALTGAGVSKRDAAQLLDQLESSGARGSDAGRVLHGFAGSMANKRAASADAATGRWAKHSDAATNRIKGKVVKDKDGNPVMGADGKPLRRGGFVGRLLGNDTGKVDEKGRKIRTGGFVGGLKAAPDTIGDLGKKGLAGGDFVKSTSDSFTEIDKKKAKDQAANIKKSADSSSRIAAEMEYNRRSAGMSEEEKKKLAEKLGLNIDK